MARFDNLSRSAAAASIYAEAGRLFQAQAATDPEKYKLPEAFNQAVWFLAEAAQVQGFNALYGKSTGQIAGEMGTSISSWWR